MHTLHLALIILYELLVVAAICHVVMDNRQPAKTMAWVLVIYFVPVVGLLFYVFLGINTRKERLVSNRSVNQLTKRAMLEFVEQSNFSVPESHKQIVDLFVNQNMALPFKNNRVKIYSKGEDYVLDLLRSIGSARHHIHVNMYIFEDDALGRLLSDALLDAAARGVEVRVIYDDVGCWKVRSAFFERMREGGVEVNAFMPVRFPVFTSRANYRNHRKVVVIDGMHGYIGGMNIALRYVKGSGGKPWRDTMVRLSGGAVYALQRMFLVDWYFTDRTLITHRAYYPPIPEECSNECLAQVVTGGPDTPYPELLQGYIRVIMQARHYLYLETPYFLPSGAVLMALKTAAVGGTDVRLIVPRHTDSFWVDWAGRSYLREVIEAGVKVYMYEGGFLHSKMLVSDDMLVTCGSANIDMRSMETNFEANVFFYDADVAGRFKQLFEEDMKHSKLVNEEAKVCQPSFLVRLLESLMRLISPLM